MVQMGFSSHFTYLIYELGYTCYKYETFGPWSQVSLDLGSEFLFHVFFYCLTVNSIYVISLSQLSSCCWSAHSHSLRLEILFFSLGLKKCKVDLSQVLTVANRRRRRPEKLLGRPLLKPKMTIHEGQVVTTDVNSGNMIFEPILEEGIFRFDCSPKDRAAAFPSLSFTSTKERDTPITIHKAPSYIPTFECLLGKQIVKLEVSWILIFNHVHFGQ